MKDNRGIASKRNRAHACHLHHHNLTTMKNDSLFFAILLAVLFNSQGLSSQTCNPAVYRSCAAIEIVPTLVVSTFKVTDEDKIAKTGTWSGFDGNKTVTGSYSFKGGRYVATLDGATPTTATTPSTYQATKQTGLAVEPVKKATTINNSPRVSAMPRYHRNVAANQPPRSGRKIDSRKQ